MDTGDGDPMKKTLFSVFSTAFVDNFGQSLVFIVFAPLLLNPSYHFVSALMSEGTKNILLGVLIGVFPLALFFSAPFWGDYADRFGRKKTLILTLLGTALGHILSAAAIFSQNLTFLLISRVIAGFFCGNISICFATISDLSADVKAKTRNFGLVTVFMGIGWILAMVLGGYLSDPSLGKVFNPAMPFFAATLITLLGYVVIQFYFTETHAPKKELHFDLIKSLHDIKSAIKNKEIRAFLLTLFIWTIGWYFTFQWFVAISLEHYAVTQQAASLRLIILGVFWILGGVFINPFLVKRFSDAKIAIVSIFLMALFILIAGFTRNYFIYSLFFCLATLAGPSSMSCLLNFISSSATNGSQGKAMGFSQSFQALAALIVPFLAGIIAKINILWIFPAGGIFLGLTFILLLSKIRATYIK
jgi:MFS transporter, DHA1 family, tetracycline resistance protein